MATNQPRGQILQKKIPPRKSFIFAVTTPCAIDPGRVAVVHLEFNTTTWPRFRWPPRGTPKDVAPIGWLWLRKINHRLIPIDVGGNLNLLNGQILNPPSLRVFLQFSTKKKNTTRKRVGQFPFGFPRFKRPACTHPSPSTWRESFRGDFSLFCDVMRAKARVRAAAAAVVVDALCSWWRRGPAEKASFRKLQCGMYQGWGSYSKVRF